MASIEPLKWGSDGKPARDSKWRARYRDPQNRSRSRTFDRKIDAQRFLHSVATDMDRGQWADPRLQRTVFDDWVEEWRVVLNVRPSTRRGYEKALARLMPTFSGQRISNIDRSSVRRFIADMREGGYAPKTIRSTVLVLKLVLDLPLEDKVIFENPAVRHRLGSYRQREPVVLTAEQFSELIDVIGFPWSVVIEVIGTTGIRPAEAAGLRLSRVDMLRRKIEIRETLTLVNGRLIAGPTKTHEARVISVPRSVIERLPVYLEWRSERLRRPLEPDDYVFGGLFGAPVSSNRLQRSVLRPAASRLGLPEGFRTYDLRHTHAAMLIANGAHPRAIMERLGHKDIKTTMNVYGHLFPELDEELTDRLDAVLTRAADHDRLAKVHELSQR